MKKSILILLISSIFLITFIHAGIPDSIPLTGKLQNDSGYYDGNMNFSFRIYDSFTGGTKLYESNQNLSVNQG